MQNGDSERLGNVPKVTQPWSSHLLGGGEWKANRDLEDFAAAHGKCIVESAHALFSVV